ncbi:hypothetical protein Pelo_588 [Pelomyxa schiedti]|nr:hypothetical protein Pelo_588 [Pelomyxa schiedti]
MQRTHAMHREGLSTTVGTDLLQLVATLRSCREACGAASWDRGEDREAAPQRVLSVKQLQDMEPRSIALLRGGDPEAPGVDLNADLFGVASNRAPVIDAITQWRRYLPRPPADGSAPPTGWVIPLRKMCADMRSCCIDGRALARRAQVDKDGAHGALSRAKAFASHLQNLENVLELAITYLLAHLLGVH